MTDRQKANDNAYFRLVELQRDNGGTECEEVPEWFFPEDLVEPELVKSATEMAKAICARCPIMIQCREYGIVAEKQYGIWGGLEPHERN